MSIAISADGVMDFVEKYLKEGWDDRVWPFVNRFHGFWQEQRYQLAMLEEENGLMGEDALPMVDGTIKQVFLYHYSVVYPQLKSPDKCVRQSLIETGIVASSPVAFYPTSYLTPRFSAPSIWNELRATVFSAFSGVDARTNNGMPAYYFKDALLILLCYLDLAIAINQNGRSEKQEALLAKCEVVLRLLPACVPLGLRQGEPNTFVVLCA